MIGGSAMPLANQPRRPPPTTALAPQADGGQQAAALPRLPDFAREHMEAGWENRALEEQLRRQRDYLVAFLGDSITAQLGCAHVLCSRSCLLGCRCEALHVLVRLFLEPLFVGHGSNSVPAGVPFAEWATPARTRLQSNTQPLPHACRRPPTDWQGTGGVGRASGRVWSAR